MRRDRSLGVNNSEITPDGVLIINNEEGCVTKLENNNTDEIEAAMSKDVTTEAEHDITNEIEWTAMTEVKQNNATELKTVARAW